MIISFSGNDGVGKSSLVEAARCFLSEKGTECRINREYNFALVKLGKCVCGDNTFQNYNRVFMSRDPGVRSPRLLRFAVMIFYPLNIYFHFSDPLCMVRGFVST